MSNAIEILRSEFDTFSVEQTFVTPAGELRAIISGIECRIGTKATLVADGLVFCQPVDPALAVFWPVFTDLVIGGVEERRWHFTNQPALVAAARDFNAAQRRAT